VHHLYQSAHTPYRPPELGLNMGFKLFVRKELMNILTLYITLLNDAHCQGTFQVKYSFDTPRLLSNYYVIATI